jgi:hypothetical protein
MNNTLGGTQGDNGYSNFAPNAVNQQHSYQVSSLAILYPNSN